MKILTAIDGYPCSDIVIDEIILRPWPKGSEARIITVVDYTIPPTNEMWAINASYIEDLDRIAVRSAEAVIDKVMKKLDANPNADLKVSKAILRGAAREVILQVAGEWPADLIMIGSHGYHGLKRLWLGSVSHSIATHAPCSVEIVR